MSQTTPTLLMFGMPGWTEVIIIAFVGLLLFGRRLPEVGRSVGKAIVEFKRGVRDVEGDLETATRPRDNRERILPPAQEPAPEPAPPPQKLGTAEPAVDKPEVPPAD